MCICLYYRYLMLLIRYLWFKILLINNLIIEYFCIIVKFVKILLIFKFFIICINVFKYNMDYYMKNCILFFKRGN